MDKTKMSKEDEEVTTIPAETLKPTKGLMDIGIDKKTRELIEKLVEAIENWNKVGEGLIALAKTVEELKEELKVTNEKLEGIRGQLR